jgi:hypothetical protein
MPTPASARITAVRSVSKPGSTSASSFSTRTAAAPRANAAAEPDVHRAREAAIRREPDQLDVGASRKRGRECVALPEREPLSTTIVK